MNTLIVKIQENYSRLSSSEKMIADYLLSTDMDIDKLSNSLGKVSEEIFVSKATFTRFAQKLGYKGFKNLIYHLKEEPTDIDEKVLFNIKSSYTEDIEMITDTLEITKVDEIVNLILETQNIAFIGHNTSQLIANESAARFHQLGLNVYTRSVYEQIIIPNNESNIGIVFSYFADKNELDYILNSNSNIDEFILITANNRISQRYSELFKIIFTIPRRNNTNSIYDTSLQFPFIIVMDILYGRLKIEIKGDL